MGKRKRKRYENDEDLFKGTTMTFGEHLEELRMCLFKAVVGLAAGFLIGLALSGRTVKAIKGPLTTALTAYEQKESVKNIRKRLADLRDDGYLLPEDPKKIEAFLAAAKLRDDVLKAYERKDPPENIRPMLDELREAGYPLPEDPGKIEAFLAATKLPDDTELKDLKYEIVYLNPGELLQHLKKIDPEQFKDVPSPPGNPDRQFSSHRLVPIFIWHKIEKDVRVIGFSAHEPFTIYIKAAFLVGLLVASPWVFWQIWSFVAAGLYPHEKRYVKVFGPFSLGLFLAGAALAFFFVFPPVLKFLFWFNEKLEIAQEIRISEWLGFVLILPLGFGIAFQLPLVMLFLERIGIFDVEAYLSRIRIAILMIFVLAMFLTPADPYSMLLMAVPLTVLYFAGILLCKYMPRSRSPFDELED